MKAESAFFFFGQSQPAISLIHKLGTCTLLILVSFCRRLLLFRCQSWLLEVENSLTTQNYILQHCTWTENSRAFSWTFVDVRRESHGDKGIRSIRQTKRVVLGRSDTRTRKGQSGWRAVATSHWERESFAMEQRDFDFCFFNICVIFHSSEKLCFAHWPFSSPGGKFWLGRRSPRTCWTWTLCPSREVNSKAVVLSFFWYHVWEVCHCRQPLHGQHQVSAPHWLVPCAEEGGIKQERLAAKILSFLDFAGLWRSPCEAFQASGH